MEFTSWDAGLHTEDGEHLAHYGVPGQKWGSRRYQYPDGTLTPEGAKRYAAKRAKYQTIASNASKSAEKMRRLKEQTASEGKVGGQAYLNYSKLEAHDSRKARKYQRKADKQAYKQVKHVWKTRSMAYTPSTKTQIKVSDIFSDESIKKALRGKQRAYRDDKKYMDYYHDQLMKQLHNTGYVPTKQEQSKMANLIIRKTKSYKNEADTYSNEAKKVLGKYSNKKLGFGGSKHSAEEFAAHLLDNLTWEMENERRQKRKGGN